MADVTEYRVKTADYTPWHVVGMSREEVVSMLTEQLRALIETHHVEVSTRLDGTCTWTFTFTPFEARA